MAYLSYLIFYVFYVVLAVLISRWLDMDSFDIIACLALALAAKGYK